MHQLEHDMSCPFPGMDPYLEMPPNWGDFVPDFLAEIRNKLLRQLFPRYNVRIEEYVLVMRDDEPLHRMQPDVAISEPPPWQQRGGVALQEATSTAVHEAIEIAYPALEPETQRHIAVIRRADDRVVTVMEMLSPSNKTPGEKGFEAYLTKRNELIESEVNLVEIDLLRGGRRLPMHSSLPQGDYYALVGRVERRPRCEVIAWRLPESLPTIPIPLAPEDDDARLDLAEAFRSVYDAGIFDRRLPYDEPLDPRPDEALAKWIDDCLAKKR
jgi:hypothetical protein